MLPFTRPHPTLSVWSATGLFLLLFAAMVGVILSAPMVSARSTTLTTAVVWVGGWNAAATGVALATWWVARRTGAGVRDGYGIVPRWTASKRLLVRMEHDLRAALVGAVALAVFLVTHGATLATSPALDGPTPVALLTRVVGAVLTELVLLGALVALFRVARMGVWDIAVLSIAGRAVLAEGGWVAFLVTALGGTVVIWLYLRTRRLTPILLAHVTAVVVTTLIGAWVFDLA